MRCIRTDVASQSYERDPLLSSTDGVRAIVELENREPSVLFSMFPGTDIHLWPYLRWPMVQSMAAIEFGSKPISSPITSLQRVRKLISQILPDPSSASHAPRNQELLFVVAGRTQASTPQGRKNWLVDDFAATYPGDSVVVQYRELGTPAEPNLHRVFERTYSFHDAELKSDIRARLLPLSAVKNRITKNLVAEVFAELDFAVDSDGIAIATAKVLRHQARVERMRKHYELLLDRVQPRIIIMDGACYGGSAAIQVRAARERGIPVAEVQHGWIGKSHGMYNFGSAMWQHELQQYLPDTLLTFGGYWSRGVSGPFDTVEVGKPHLELLASQTPSVTSRKKSVLFASSVNDRNETVRAVLSLRDALPSDWRVIFRPHPSERATVTQLFPEFVRADRVDIDLMLDVYDSLSQVRGVFGYSSTVLYEALKFGCRTFVLDSALATFYTDSDTLGAPIADSAGLRTAVSTLVENKPSIDSGRLDDLWAPDSLRRFREFVERSMSGTRP